MLRIKMRYSIEPRNRVYVKKDGFLSFIKNMCKNLSNKYDQKLLDTDKKSTTDAIKTASKRKIKKTEEATGDLIGNKIANEITSASKRSSKELLNCKTEAVAGRATTKKIYISPDEIQ